MRGWLAGKGVGDVFCVPQAPIQELAFGDELAHPITVQEADFEACVLPDQQAALVKATFLVTNERVPGDVKATLRFPLPDGAVVCAFSLHRSETRPGRRRGVQSNAAKYLLCALGANFAWRAYRLRSAAPLDEEGEVPEAAQALAAVILLLGLVGLLASCFEGAGQQRDRRRRAIAEYSRRAKVE